MSNWYTKYAYNRGIPLMDNPDLKYRDNNPYKNDPKSLVKANPLFGGNQRENYPEGYSKDEEKYQIFGLDPHERLIDDEIIPGEGVGGQDSTFADPVDDPVRPSKKPDPVGPHHMPHTVYDVLKKKEEPFSFVRRV